MTEKRNLLENYIKIIPGETIIACNTSLEAQKLWEIFRDMGYVRQDDYSQTAMKESYRSCAFYLDPFLNACCFLPIRKANTLFSELFPKLASVNSNEKKESPSAAKTEQDRLDAWQLAKDIQYRYTDKELEEIFGTTNRAGLMETFSPAELQEAIIAHKRELEKKTIRANDIVWMPDMKEAGIAVRQNPKNRMWSVMTKDFKYVLKKPEDLERTGTSVGLDSLARTIAEIERNILRHEASNAQDSYEEERE